MGQLLQSTAISCALLLLPACAYALEDISFNYPSDTPKELRTHIEEASILLQSKTDGNDEPQEIVAAALSDYGRILSALYSEGRYSGIISILIDGAEAADISVFNTPEKIKEVQVNVDPGALFTFSDIDIHPRAPLYIDQPQSEHIATGAPAHSSALADAVQEKIQEWRAIGYAEASIDTQDVIANHDVNTLRADVQINPGPRFVFGDLIPKDGNTDVDIERIREVSGLPHGKVFDPEQVEEAALRLRRTGAFKSVSTTEVPRSDRAVIDIEAKLVEEKPKRIGFGAEYLSPGGFSLNGFWLHRNFDDNLDRLRFDFEIKDIDVNLEGEGTDYKVGARFERPAFIGPDTLLFLDTGASYNQEPTFDMQEFRIGAGVQRKFGSDILGEVGFNLEFGEAQDAFGEREFISYNFPTKFSLNRTDNILDPKFGYSIKSQITPFLSAGDAGIGVWSHFDGRAYYTMGQNQDTTFALRAQAGTVSLKNIEDVPPDYLFYSGGGGTVRGHAYQSLGVELPNGRKTGGKSFFSLSTEVRKDVNDKVGVVGFFDIGQVGTGTFLTKEDRWHVGAGIGLRYDTPVGPARIDLAVPLKGERSSDYQIYIGIGHSF